MLWLDGDTLANLLRSLNPTMPPTTPERNQRRLRTFRIAYRNLRRSVRNVIRMQLGDLAYLREESKRATSLLRASWQVCSSFSLKKTAGYRNRTPDLIRASQHTQLFDAQELDRLQSGIQLLLQVLKKAISQSKTHRAPKRLEVWNVQRAHRGRPKKAIHYPFLKKALQYCGPVGIARVLGVSRRTVRRRIVDYGLDVVQAPIFSLAPDGVTRIYRQPQSRSSTMTDEHLDALVADALEIFPTFGIRLVKGYLKSLQYRIPWVRIAHSLQRLNGAPGVFGPRTISRRVYSVSGPNALWHGDANLGTVFANRLNESYADSVLL